MSKIDLSSQSLGDILVAGKLLAVVERNGVNQFLERTQQAGGGIPSLFGRPSDELVDQGETRLAVHKREQRALMSSADDGVALPVSQAVSSVHDCRSLIDADSPFELPPAVSAASVAFPVGLLASQVRVQIAAPGLVGIDIKVDPLGADPDSLFLIKPGGNLLGAQVEPDKPLHVLPVIARDSLGDSSFAPLTGKPVGLGRPIASLTAVSPDLTADRRSVPARFSGYLTQIVSRFQKSLNLISFFLGKLRVTSHSAPLLGRSEVLMLPQLTSLKRPSVALGS